MSGHARTIVFNNLSLHELVPETDPITTCATMDILEMDQVNNNSIHGYHLLRVYYMTQCAKYFEYSISFNLKNNLMMQVLLLYPRDT